MKNKSLLRTLIIPYIAVMIFWNYREYVIYSEMWSDFYIWSIWDTIKYNIETIIVVTLISLAVNYAGRYIIKHGDTRDIFTEEAKSGIRNIFKWVNKGLNLILGFCVIKAALNTYNDSPDYGIIGLFVFYLRPTLLWFAVQDILKGICELFTAGIDEEDNNKEANNDEHSEVVIEQAETNVPQNETVSEEIADKPVKDTVEEEKIAENGEKQNSSYSVAKGVIIVGALVLIGAWTMHSCARNASFDSDAGKSTSVGEDTTEKKEYTLEEYLSNCVVVDTETIGRNPDKYIGMDVLIEDKFTMVGSTLSVGFARTTYPMKVEYDGAAYDLDLNSIGNVLSGDFGFVAGKCVSEDCIHAEIIVLYGEGKGSYEQLINSNATSEQETQNAKENTGTESNEVANMEETLMQTYDMYEYMFSEEEGKTPVDFFINAGMGYEMEPTGRGCEYYSTDIDAWFTSDADYVECYVSGDNSRDYGVTLYGLYIGLEENEVYSFFEVENQGDESLILWTEDEAGYLEISFAYGKVSELHFYYSYE